MLKDDFFSRIDTGAIGMPQNWIINDPKQPTIAYAKEEGEERFLKAWEQHALFP